MNITWGFINASVQTPKNNEGARQKQWGRRSLELGLLGVYSASACSSADFSSSAAWQERPREGRRATARAGSFATQMN